MEKESMQKTLHRNELKIFMKTAPKCKGLVSRHSIGNHVLACEHVKISKDTLTLGKKITKKFSNSFEAEDAYFLQKTRACH